jgi:hypothetical protein
MMRNIVIAVFASGLLLSGCAKRGTITLAPEAARTGNVVEIFVATSRGATGTAAIASRARSDAVRWGVFDVSVPPESEPRRVCRRLQLLSGLEHDGQDHDHVENPASNHVHDARKRCCIPGTNRETEPASGTGFITPVSDP